jgi:hypothetical protein
MHDLDLSGLRGDGRNIHSDGIVVFGDEIENRLADLSESDNYYIVFLSHGLGLLKHCLIILSLLRTYRRSGWGRKPGNIETYKLFFEKIVTADEGRVNVTLARQKTVAATQKSVRESEQGGRIRYGP